MGQYYRPTLISPKGQIQSLNPYAFDNGAKLTESSWIGNNLMNAAYSLIYTSNKRVAWIGDYAEQAYETCGEEYTKALPFNKFQKVYKTVWVEDRDGLPPKLFSERDLGILDFDTQAYMRI